jgi:hypothetical protein
MGSCQSSCAWTKSIPWFSRLDACRRPPDQERAYAGQRHAGELESVGNLVTGASDLNRCGDRRAGEAEELTWTPGFGTPADEEDVG